MKVTDDDTIHDDNTGVRRPWFRQTGMLSRPMRTTRLPQPLEPRLLLPGLELSSSIPPTLHLTVTKKPDSVQSIWNHED